MKAKNRLVCTLTARWSTRRPPMVGMWLKADKGRTAYEIVEVIKIKNSTNRRGYNFRLKCAKHTPSDIPDHVTVHRWYWDKRG